jgi:hypothetical protein
MSIFFKPLDQVDESDLEALIENKVAEKRDVEYKRELPGKTDSDKKEFLADVSSLANDIGGHIIYGMEEKDSMPINLCGLDVSNLDETKLGLEQSALQGITPRISGLRIHTVQLRNQKTAIIIYVPQSFAAPHMVTYRNSSRFHSRNGGSPGKHQMDYNQIRDAFVMSQSLIDRIRSFRQERLDLINSGQTPIPITSLHNLRARLVLHIIPLSAFSLKRPYDLGKIEALYFRPLYEERSSTFSSRYNFDGRVLFGRQVDLVTEYIQFFRNGILEVVDANSCVSAPNNQCFIHSDYEKRIISKLPTYIKQQIQLGVDLPLTVMFSFLNVSNYAIAYNDGWGRILQAQYPIERQNLLLPEILIDNIDNNEQITHGFHVLMKPVFDMVWNAVNLPRSMNYDEKGNFKV